MERVEVVVVGGGQSGQAAARALRARGLAPVVLEASDRPAGSWPHYYDGLTLFSPARYSAPAELPFDGDPDRYPGRDEVVAHLLRGAELLDAPLRLRTRVREIRPRSDGFEVTTADGERWAARAVVTASGSFGNPHRPALPGPGPFTGTLLHAAEYREPTPFAGRRVVVLGLGNSAVQIAAELAGVARVTLAGRGRIRWTPQRPLGRDLHHWLGVTGLDTAPVGPLLRTPPRQPVIDDGRYRAALRAGGVRTRPVFTAVEGNRVTWPDGVVEEVDTVLLATGYRPDLGYLAPLGVLDRRGVPRHRGGLSTVRPGLAHLGLEWQRSLASNTLRGVGRDARHVARALERFLRRG
ncbi:ArsO family NAD(P)H-dependent flavin-containing monooxygenase [Streptomyces calidiresistens]|uniref:SidA/IucD/PvdA family monooxygenase n=1 Tax=Streptomyces calidiresistens TaxID=1485586 RepID=A0A7W3T3V4_9ACTN|nr:NAD(P)-binding domain-containing protein [Streptomyces calidiresistens]MBB0230126.1 SidA/IucD/PvdA family monooxygenase [Streptomyces calidiresistens]